MGQVGWGLLIHSLAACLQVHPLPALLSPASYTGISTFLLSGCSRCLPCTCGLTAFHVFIFKECIRTSHTWWHVPVISALGRPGLCKPAFTHAHVNTHIDTHAHTYTHTHTRTCVYRGGRTEDIQAWPAGQPSCLVSGSAFLVARPLGSVEIRVLPVSGQEQTLGVVLSAEDCISSLRIFPGL